MKAAPLLLAAACLGLAAPAVAAQDTPQFGEWGVDTSGISARVAPGDDFYRYVNEGWLRSATLPVGMPEYNDATRIYLANEARFRDIVKTVLAAPHKAGSPEQQIADTYRAYFDIKRLNALGTKPLAADLKAIGRLRSHRDIAVLSATPWFTGPFVTGVLSDPDKPLRYMPAISQGGLTLPTEYYIKEGPDYAGLRSALTAYISGILRRGGMTDPDAGAARIVALETALAHVQWGPQQRRDVVRMYHPMTLQELKAHAPGFDWQAYFNAYGYPGGLTIDVTTDSAVREIARLFAATPVATWREFMTFHLLDSMANSLGADWQEAHFDFHQRKLMGIAQQRDLETRTIAAANADMGPQIGKLYVQRYFPPEYRAQVDTMVGYIRGSFADRIGKLTWMDDTTKAEARQKLEKVAGHIGYPDRWPDRSNVVIRPDDLVGNGKRMALWVRQDELKKLSEPRRDWEWPYSPQEVNAGYVASLNSITFPAGILQPPFFDPAADPAVNFGAIAAVIGHEFGHGFDDQGSRSDGDGRLRDWWTPASRAEFEKRTAGLVDQYNAYEPVPGLRINGQQNLGENIGDLGGLSIAYEAYRRYVADKQGGRAPVVGGFTGDQRFFLAWAQVWRNIVTPDEERRRVLSDNHSAGEFRVNGVVRNMDAWYAAFDIGPDAKLYLPPEKRVRIW